MNEFGILIGMLKLYNKIPLEYLKKFGGTFYGTQKYVQEISLKF